MWRHLQNIYRLGVKELWSLWRDPAMLFLIVFTFSFAVYSAGTAMPETLHRTPIAIVDEDQSALSLRITDAFYPPAFGQPQLIAHHQIDPGLDAGDHTLVLVIPPAAQMDPGRLAAFNIIFAQSPRIMLGGIAAYFVSVFINVRVFSALGARSQAAGGGSGLALMLRGGVASAVAQVIDGLIFITIAFYGVFPILPLLAGQITAKLVLSFTAVPLLIRLGVVFGRRLDASAGSEWE